MKDVNCPVMFTVTVLPGPAVSGVSVADCGPNLERYSPETRYALTISAHALQGDGLVADVLAGQSELVELREPVVVAAEVRVGRVVAPKAATAASRSACVGVTSELTNNLSTNAPAGISLENCATNLFR